MLRAIEAPVDFLIRSRAGRVLVAAVAAGSLAAGCGLEGFNRTRYEAREDPRLYVARELKAHRVKDCVGRATVKESGNIRTEPAIGGGNFALSNRTEFDTTVFHNPMRVDNTGYGEVNEHWYMGKDDKDTLVFVNQNALESVKNLHCSEVAGLEDLPGNVTVTREDIAVLHQK